MPDENRPLFGEDAAAVGRALVSGSVEHDTEMVRDALHAIWVDSVVDAWLVGRNAFLDGARPVDLLAANDLAQVMDAVWQEVQGGYR